MRFDTGRVLPARAHRPALAAALPKATALKQRALAQRMQELTLAEPKLRVYAFLRRLCPVLVTPAGTDWKVGLDVSQRDVAALTGLSRVSVTRALKALRDEGLIRGGRGGIHLSVPAAPADPAGGWRGRPRRCPAFAQQNQ